MLAFCICSVVFYVPHRIGLPQFCRHQEREAERDRPSLTLCLQHPTALVTRSSPREVEGVITPTTRKSSLSTREKQTSRTIIRATWLRLLPGVHLWSIHQLVSLGS